MRGPSTSAAVLSLSRVYTVASVYRSRYDLTDTLSVTSVPGPAMSSAKMLRYFSTKIYGSSFIAHHSEAVNGLKLPKCRLQFKKTKIIASFVVILGTHWFASALAASIGYVWRRGALTDGNWPWPPPQDDGMDATLAAAAAAAAAGDGGGDAAGCVAR